MWQVNRIDSNGMFVEPIVLEDGQVLTEAVTDADGNVTYQPRADIITVSVPEGFHHPKWDGMQWVEGKTDAELLPIAKQAKIAELVAARDAEINSQFTSSALGSAKTYSYDTVSQGRFKGKMIMINSNPNITSVEWVNHEDGLANHTRAEFIQVVMDAGTHEENAIYKFFTLQSQVNAATTLAEVEAITW